MKFNIAKINQFLEIIVLTNCIDCSNHSRVGYVGTQYQKHSIDQIFFEVYSHRKFGNLCAPLTFSLCCSIISFKWNI